MYDTQKINEIPIREVAEMLGIPMKKKGIHMWAQCLWHDDHNASMIVGSNDGKHNVCHCFACGENKSVIDLIMQHEHCGFLDACKWAAQLSPDVVLCDGEKPVNRKKMLAKRSEQRVNKPITSPIRVDSWSDKTKEMSTPTMDVEAMTGDRYGSSFARCLKEVFGKDRMEDVVDTYFLRAWKRAPQAPPWGDIADDVLFPSIDVKGVIRDFKVQRYEWRRDIPPTGGLGGFFHSYKKCTYWLGPKLYPDMTFDRNCLFGEHLLPYYPDKVVALVESPKNACVGYAQYPQYLWVAVGNKNMLKRQLMEVLQGRTVVIFPDEDAYKEWQGKIDSMRDIAAFKLFHTPGDGEKRDIADWIINLHKSLPPQTLPPRKPPSPDPPPQEGEGAE